MCICRLLLQTSRTAACWLALRMDSRLFPLALLLGSLLLPPSPPSSLSPSPVCWNSSLSLIVSESIFLFLIFDFFPFEFFSLLFGFTSEFDFGFGFGFSLLNLLIFFARVVLSFDLFSYLLKFSDFLAFDD
jgi:hypothetical protein